MTCSLPCTSPRHTRRRSVLVAVVALRWPEEDEERTIPKLVMASGTTRAIPVEEDQTRRHCLWMAGFYLIGSFRYRRRVLHEVRFSLSFSSTSESLHLLNHTGIGMIFIKR